MAADQVQNSDLSPTFYETVRLVLSNAREKAVRAVLSTMVEAYWQVGRLIVEEEQQGQQKAAYGSGLLKQLAVRLTQDFGKGFDEREVRRIRQFYLTFPNRDALRPELSWTHYRTLLRVSNPTARKYYLMEAATQNWSSRQLERQITSLYYERRLASKEPAVIEKEAQQQAQQLATRPEDLIKDPYVLEFLKLDPDKNYLEKELEQALIDKLQQFLLELGKGFSFVARQQRISTDTKHFYIDLVFYNYILKCFILIDLKTGELSHQDIGQMDMYVRLYEDKMKVPGDNPTIGIILCTERDETIVKYSVLEESKHLFASRYQLYLPTEQELIAEVEHEKALILSTQQEATENFEQEAEPDSQ